MADLVCEAVTAVVFPAYADRAIVKTVPLTTESLHLDSAVHRCSGEHKDLGGIPIHICYCGTTFYYLRDALAILVSQYEDLLMQLEVIEP